MKRAEKLTPIAAAVTSLATLYAAFRWNSAAATPPDARWFSPVAVPNSELMSTRAIVLSLLGLASGCAAPPISTLTLSPDASAAKLVFLTRGGCVNTTTTMRGNLDAAVNSLSVAFRYEVVAQGTLPEDDMRRGYLTPTLLYGDRDVFGMPPPMPPLTEPT